LKKKYTSAEKERWFQYYFSLGEERTLRKVAEYFKVPIDTVRKVSQQEEWSKRIDILKENLEAKTKEQFQEVLERNIQNYLETIFSFSKVIKNSIEELAKNKRKLPIETTRDLKNIVEAFRAIAELELRLREDRQEPISIVIAKELVPKIEEVIPTEAWNNNIKVN